MKKEYLEPEIDVVKFTLTKDILTESDTRPTVEDEIASGGVDNGEDPGVSPR